MNGDTQISPYLFIFRLLGRVECNMARVVSPDAFLLDESGRYRWTAERCVAAWNRAYEALDRELPAARKLVLMVGLPGAGKTTWLQDRNGEGIVYFDATLTRREDREALVARAHQVGVEVEAVVLLTPLAECIRRNGQRPADRQVPWDSLSRMADQLKANPVSTSEGFAKVTIVR